jgi:hypothetical protein
MSFIIQEPCEVLENYVDAPGFEVGDLFHILTMTLTLAADRADHRKQ